MAANNQKLARERKESGRENNRNTLGLGGVLSGEHHR